MSSRQRRGRSRHDSRAVQRPVRSPACSAVGAGAQAMAERASSRRACWGLAFDVERRRGRPARMWVGSVAGAICITGEGRRRSSRVSASHRPRPERSEITEIIPKPRLSERRRRWAPSTSAGSRHGARYRLDASLPVGGGLGRACPVGLTTPWYLSGEQSRRGRFASLRMIDQPCFPTAFDDHGRTHDTTPRSYRRRAARLSHAAREHAE
jgi:hypothetical protein